MLPSIPMPIWRFPSQGAPGSGGLSHVWTLTQLCSHPGIILLMGILGFFHGFN